ISDRDFACWMTRSPSLRRRAPRCEAVSFGHGPDVNAVCAALTARSTSSAVHRGISAHGLPVYGLSVSKNWPDAESTQCPAMWVWYLTSSILCSAGLQACTSADLKVCATCYGRTVPAAARSSARAPLRMLNSEWLPSWHAYSYMP